MNKSEFIKELSKQTSYNEERCNTINNIVEDTFIIGKKNKEKILRLAEQNVPKAQIARMFKVDRSTIRRFIAQNVTT